MTFAYDHLMERVAHRDAFYNDVATAVHQIWEIDDTFHVYDYYMLLTIGMPICLGSYIVTHSTWDWGPHPIYYSRDWEACEKIIVPYADTVDQSMVNLLKGSNYVQSGGRVQQFYWDSRIPTVAGVHLPYIPLGASTTKSLYEWYKILPTCIFKYEGQYKFKPQPVHLGSVSSAGADSSWSAQNWPELVGIRTQYINNVGCFIPDWTDVDYNLSHTLGSNFLALRVVREPNSDVENSRFTWDYVRDFLEFFMANSGGQSGPAQGIINTYKFGMGQGEEVADQLRLIYPRIRAFGRQTDPIMGYSEYVSGIKSVLGSDGWNWRGDNEVKISYSKLVSILSVESYDEFVTPFVEMYADDS